MKLPNGENAIVAIEKLIDYCLSTDHPRGKHKARVFAAACGITAENSDLLLQALLEAAQHGKAVPGLSDDHGQRFTVEWELTGPNGTANLMSAWIVRRGERIPRFVRAYIREE